MDKNIFAIAFFLVTVTACTQEKMAPPEQKPKPAPQFSLSNLEGEKVTLADLKGKPAIINFWATWCAPCVEELPMLETFYRAKKSDTGLTVVAINIKESKKIVEEFVSTHGYSLVTLLDETGKVSEDFQVFGLPTTFFINADGDIVFTHMGLLTKELIYAGFEKTYSAKSSK